MTNTNIAKRSAKTTKKTKARKAVAKALNKAVEEANKVQTKAETKAQALTAWATVRDDQITGLYASRTKARNAREEKLIFGEDLGTVRKALVQLV